jgi:hypothetical protein
MGGYLIMNLALGGIFGGNIKRPTYWVNCLSTSSAYILCIASECFMRLFGITATVVFSVTYNNRLPFGAAGLDKNK